MSPPRAPAVKGNAHRDLAVKAMGIMTAADGAYILPQNIPQPKVEGALPAMARELVPAQFLHMRVDIDMIWTIADWDEGYDCSSYYDPASPWYNVLFGAYGLRSYKPKGTAWGYHRDGTPDFDEFLHVPRVDYDFLTGGMFGCKPDQMCFEVKSLVPSKVGRWDRADLVVTVPSGLHDPLVTLADPSTYIIYGVPDPSFLTGDRKPYEPVPMRGSMYMRQVKPGPQAVTYAWGVLCPDTADGQNLCNTVIMPALEAAYLTL